MIKYRVIIGLFLLLGFSQSYAQTGLNTFSSGTDLSLRNIQNVQPAMYSNGTDPIGNASLEDYYSKEWEVVRITFDNNVTQKYDKVRYNIDKKHLELKVGDKVYFSSTEKITELVFTESNKVFISKKEDAKLGLLEVVAEYKNIVFVTAYAITKLNENQNSYNSNAGEPSLRKSENYYLLKNNESLFKVSKNKKKNAKFFEEQWGEVAKFAKKEKLSFKKKNDIMKIMEFYATLKS